MSYPRPLLPEEQSPQSRLTTVLSEAVNDMKIHSDRKFAAMDQKFAAMDERMRNKFAIVEGALRHNSRRLDELETAVGRVEGKVDNLEDKVDNLEATMSTMQTMLEKILDRL